MLNQQTQSEEIKINDDRFICFKINDVYLFGKNQPKVISRDDEKKHRAPKNDWFDEKQQEILQKAEDQQLYFDLQSQQNYNFKQSKSKQESKKNENTSIIQSDQIYEKLEVIKPIDNRRPSHFFSFPLIQDSFQDQISVWKYDIFYNLSEEYDQYISDFKKIHLTLFVLKLYDQQTKDKAVKVFKDLNPQIKALLQQPLKLLVKGVGFFGANEDAQTASSRKRKVEQQARVLYAKIEKNEGFQIIQKIFDLLVRAFITNGLIDNNDLKHIRFDQNINLYELSQPHITLMKVSQFHKELINVAPLIKRYKTFDFGEVNINTVDLSCMETVDQNGYYEPLFRFQI